MLLAHVSFTHAKDSYTDLCLIPDEESNYVEPTRIRLLRPRASAVFHIGPKEAVMAYSGDSPNSLIIEPFAPAPLYLTPNSPTQPGFRIAIMKITPIESDFKIEYKTKNSPNVSWKVWEANKVRTE